MYSEEETELRDLIMQNLENCGFLNKIKAELRAGVFLALEEDGNLKNKIPLFNQKFEDFISTSDGKLIISLVREFLQYFSLNFTLSVFDPEVAAPLSHMSRNELCDKLNLRISEDDGPVILSLLKEDKGIQNHNFSSKSSDILNVVPEKTLKTASNENITRKDILEDGFNHKNSDNKEKPFIHSTFEKDHTIKSSKGNFDTLGSFPKPINDEGNVQKTNISDIFKEKSDRSERDDQSSIFKESNDVLSSDHSFFDQPLPSDKTSFFTFSDSLNDKSESRLIESDTKKDLDNSKKSSLSSLKDLPSLTANEWKIPRDPKSTLLSLDSLKSVSSSEASEEVINLDSKEVFEKKDSDVVESNEESSEKQISEESIEEELDESSAGFEDLLASPSLSLADDLTTDHTVSQVSVVEGVDHVEPCK